MAYSRKITVVFLVILGFGLLYFLHNFNPPGKTLLWRAISNAGHIPLFGLMALVVLQLIRLTIGRKLIIWHIYLGTFLFCGLLGFLSEVLQIDGARDADFWDIVRDLVGVIFYLGITVTREIRILSQKQRLTIIAIAFGVLFLGLMPLTITSISYLHRNSNFPIISTFDNRWDRTFCKMMNVTLKTVESPSGFESDWGDRFGFLTFYPEQFSEIKIIEPKSDWSGYEKLGLDIYSNIDDTLHLYLKIEDVDNNGEFNDRFNRKFNIEPGINLIKLSLSEIINGPEFRKLDIKEISAITIFAYETKEEFSIFINRLCLE